MHSTVRIASLDHSSTATALQIHAVQLAAYSKEAELIGAKDFPPLARTLDDLRSSSEEFFGAYVGSRLAGAASVEFGEAWVGVSSLVVLPERHRQGVGRALLLHLIERYGSGEIRVQTAARNGPALALYLEAGFIEVMRWSVGAAPLELVELRRPRVGAQNVANPSFHRAFPS